MVAFKWQHKWSNGTDDFTALPTTQDCLENFSQRKINEENFKILFQISENLQQLKMTTFVYGCHLMSHKYFLFHWRYIFNDHLRIFPHIPRKLVSHKYLAINSDIFDVAIDLRWTRILIIEKGSMTTCTVVFYLPYNWQFN